MPVDVSAAVAADEAAFKELNRVGGEMKGAASRAARKEKTTHLWRNRTGRMQRSTEALGPYQRGDEKLVVLQIATPYAGFVDARGLVRIDTYADQAATEIDYFIHSLKV